MENWIYFSLNLNKTWRAEPILLSVLLNLKWQMRIEFLERRRPARSSWDRRSQNKMFWQLSWGHGRVLSSQFQTSRGDPSSILISGTSRAKAITESRSYKPSGNPSNHRLIFTEVIYYTATGTLYKRLRNINILSRTITDTYLHLLSHAYHQRTSRPQYITRMKMKQT